jgi:phosphate transport system substrate-binding protein
MTNVVRLIVACALLLLLGCEGGDGRRTASDGLEGTITISGAWALYPMAVRWAEEFERIHPGVKLDVAAGGAGKGMADALARVVDLGAVSRDLYPAEIERGAWWVSVTKDAVVATMNEHNPVAADLLLTGVSRESCIGIWVTGGIGNWGEVVGRDERYPIRVYTRSDACGAAKTWAAYLGYLQDDLGGVGVYGDPGVALAVKKDPLGIGYNNISYAYDPMTKVQVDGIRVVPIDLDGDGRISAGEDFYGTRDDIVAAIASGAYPSPPARDLHFVSHGRPTRRVVVEFLRWVLTEGQRYVPETGYIRLSEERIEEGLGKLGE